MQELTHTTSPTPIEWAPGEFETLWESLPPPPAPVTAPPLYGRIGKRVQEHMRATIPDGELREFAREALGAKRMSAAYLDALRITLGNQAHAERYSRRLELNIKTPHAPSITERTMRTIVDQMANAGIARGIRTELGEGKTQVVQVFFSSAPRPDLETLLRLAEAPACGRSTPAVHIPAFITEAELPF